MGDFTGEAVLEGLTGLLGADRNFKFHHPDVEDARLRFRSSHVGQLRMTHFLSRFDVDSRAEGAADRIYFQFVETGSVHFVRQNGETLGASEGELLTVMIPQGERLRVAADDERIGVGVSHQRLLEIASRHFGLIPPRSLTFSATVSARSGPLAEVRSVAKALLASDSAFEHVASEARKAYEDAIAVSFLLGVPSNISALLRRTEAQVAPAYIRRAEEFMRAHLYEAITLEEIAAAAGCTARNLQLNFRSMFGVPPMRYLRKLRMEDARRRLESHSDETATMIAMSLGFTNLGRFAKDYKVMYGELPSHARRTLTPKVHKDAG